MRRINFVRGVPADEAFPRAQLADCARAVVLANDAAGLRYGDAAGPLLFREWVAQQHGLEIDRVMLANGSLSIFDMLMRTLANTGAAILLEVPCYDRIIDMVRAARIEMRTVTLHRSSIDLDAMAEAVGDGRVAYFYCVPDFQNPSGNCYDLESRLGIISLARKHGFKIIEDSPYRALRYQGEALPRFVDLAPDVTLHMTSFSKIIAPGLRAAYLVASPATVTSLRKMAESTYVTPGNFALSVAGEWLQRGHLEPQIRRLQTLYRPKRDAMVEALKRRFGDCEFAVPEGGFFTGLSLRRAHNLAPVVDELAERGIDIQDGKGFFPMAPTKTFLRLPFCSMSTKDIETGIEALADAIQNLEALA